MRTFLVVEFEIAPQVVLGHPDALVVVQIHLLILNRAPQAFDENIV
jgi:hypothetical protein